MHDEAFDWIDDVVTGLPAPAVVVEFGARNINGTARVMFPRDARYIGVDLVPGDGVDVVADAATYVPPEPADIVVCAEVLEHAPEAAQIVANAIRSTRPGGHVVITCAGPDRKPHSGLDGRALRDGEWYQGVALATLMEWIVAAGGDVVLAADCPDVGDVYALAERPEAP